ncbi:hypothetical protein AB0301_10190 [Microbacterium profundi]|uniref:Uncharacterized protein n=1 Tax=Microbacterium profundi TaxID=450380 RepID=A0ABV3LHP2_9MICO
MDTFVAVLPIVYLFLMLVVVILVISLRSRPTAAADAARTRQERQLLANTPRADQSAQRQELRDALHIGQQLLEHRVTKVARHRLRNVATNGSSG